MCVCVCVYVLSCVVYVLFRTCLVSAPGAVLTPWRPPDLREMWVPHADPEVFVTVVHVLGAAVG